MSFKNRIKYLREVESKINRHLYWICAAITIVAMVMTVIEFFSRGRFIPTQMDLFYLGVLLLYSFHKELVRWLGKRYITHQGEYFVYAWIVLTTLLYIINFSSNGFYSYSPLGESLTTLRDLSLLTLEILAIFILTRCLKILRVVLIKPED